ncbi:hypothetical protein AB0B78_15310 [Streptomyces sp. NPDC040724]|uniref:hypothetical protein n=1 Tax=Streptomyces sp. NPDC040724 TaxID=3155612 RepID=UPI0033CAE6C0
MESGNLAKLRAQFCGVWVHDFAARDGVLKGAWDLKKDGTFSFRWKETVGFGNIIKKGSVSGWRGEWNLTGDGDPLHLTLMPTKVTTPLQYAFDAAYLLNPGTALILAFRGLVVIGGHAHMDRIKNGAFRFSVLLSGVEPVMDTVLLELNTADLGKRSVWPGLSDSTKSSIRWDRFTSA